VTTAALPHCSLRSPGLAAELDIVRWLKNRMRLAGALLGVTLLPGILLGWELAAKTLAERQ
jgi:hypothetical protein